MDNTTESNQVDNTNSATNPVVGGEPNAVSSDSAAPNIEVKDDGVTSDQVDELKNESIQFAKSFAKSGPSVRKEPSPNLANDQGPYTWWDKQASYESNSWSVSLWEYDNKNWQLQATKVELQPDGRSRMTAYSMRKDTDNSFPGFQIYREQRDDRYHPAEVEDIVYLNRVLKGLVGTTIK